MNWKDKFEVLCRMNASMPMLGVFSCTNDPAPQDFVIQLQQRYPWLPNAYVEFLKTTDGAKLDTFIFYGSGKDCATRSIDSLIERWETMVPLRERLPFCVDATGSILCIEKDGLIVRLDSEEPTESTKVADDFDRLLNDVIMGERFLEYFPDYDEEDLEADDWICLLREQGWMSA